MWSHLTNASGAKKYLLLAAQVHELEQVRWLVLFESQEVYFSWGTQRPEERRPVSCLTQSNLLQWCLHGCRSGENSATVSGRDFWCLFRWDSSKSERESPGTTQNYRLWELFGLEVGQIFASHESSLHQLSRSGRDLFGRRGLSYRVFLLIEEFRQK
jgi:hypothetical protein